MSTPLHVLSGVVIEGRGYGRVLGFPTANLGSVRYEEGGSEIPSGVFAGTAHLPTTNTTYPAGIVVAPSKESGLPTIEAHLIGFTGDLYGQSVTLSLTRYLRAFQTFPNEQELKRAIAGDLERVRQYER